ncbi:SEL1-like repeat protein [Dyella amyloliquefaciens]|uniref:SEL1-like repeat protein n=1 Tax=Dyella amyloliquefaciens TaxID=1770545 RepID=UPI00102E8ABB|nr:SEL1-like repeat protein [Dyella amyloliquefaciens]
MVGAREMFCTLVLIATTAACPSRPALGTVLAVMVPGDSDAAKAATEFRPDRSLEEVGASYCARGLERFLPGSYYYCVGRRELAKGHAAASANALEQAARWASKQAQFLLGVGYYKGDFVPLDRARGLAWLTLAAERGDVVYLAVLNSARGHALPEELRKAEQLLQDMKMTYGDEVAARRAERRYRRERDALTRGEVYGAVICIEGLNVDHIGSGGCQAAQPVWMVARKVDNHAAELFQGWQGHVTVGDLQPWPNR